MERLAVVVFVLAILIGCAPPPATQPCVIPGRCILPPPLATSAATQTATPDPTITLTPDLPVEVTAVPTPAIIETGVADLEVGAPKYAPGTLTPYWARNVRQCESLDCPVVDTLAANKPYHVEGRVLDELHQIWLCRFITNDAHGAQFCDGAVLWFIGSQRFGDFVADEEIK